MIEKFVESGVFTYKRLGDDLYSNFLNGFKSLFLWDLFHLTRYGDRSSF